MILPKVIPWGMRASFSSATRMKTSFPLVQDPVQVKLEPLATVPPRTVIVTGANRGIGLAICNLILSRPDLRPLRLIATSRKGTPYELDAAAHQQGGVEGGGVQIRHERLDISDSDSIKDFVLRVQREVDGVDVLINNAGINLDAQYSVETARRTLDVNYRGTLQMCRSLIPLLGPHSGRIVNLSSIASSLKAYSLAIRNRFRDPNLTFEGLDELVEEYLTSVSEHREADLGFAGPGRAYSISKACLNATTRILAHQHPHLDLNACCPGWVSTDMGRLIGKPPKKPADGARIPVRLAFGDIGRVTGAYWANASVRGKGEGEVQEW